MEWMAAMNAAAGEWAAFVWGVQITPVAAMTDVCDIVC